MVYNITLLVGNDSLVYEVSVRGKTYKEKSFSLSSCLHLLKLGLLIEKLKSRILFAGRPIACEMGVLKVFLVDVLGYCIE